MHETIYTLLSCPVSIALLSDLHNRPFAPVIASLQRHKPTIIAITGDILYGSQPEGNESPLDTQENVLSFLHSCASIAPTYLSLGNHEWMLDAEDLRLLSSTGVTVLDSTFITTTVGNEKITIAGLTSGYVTDYRAFRSTQLTEPRYPRQETISGIGGAVAASRHKPDTTWLPSFTSQSGYKIILSHHPEYWPLLKDESIDLVLSGHAHGGQIRMYNPFKREWIGTWSPGQGWWPRYTKGVYEGRLVVSAGLSNTTWVPRLSNPTEVVYIEGS